ncbi:PAS domain S-box protein [Stieleria sp. JC731]|uniref:PAS domain S-box protein n=1 Tax=Pirellulaceae TaxID=2691357 RepID=UPI001E5D7F68|nr:PAS domain S-box protein [Stieleria sp. JC731]MCC9601690.1 PAS domain S-box protein [Stieleria sp. JC731]
MRFLSSSGDSDHRELSAVESTLRNHFHSIHVRTDRMFAVLMLLQWLGAFAIAAFTSRLTWDGANSSPHPHLLMAVFGGGALALFPIFLAVYHPGTKLTRMVITCSQALFSTLLIHLSGGRIETHFHVFGSLAFLAAYRDPTALLTATSIVALDHWARGVWWPESVFGIATASQWRWLEHAGWVLFELLFLLTIVRQSVSEMSQSALRKVQLDQALELAEESEQRFRGGFEQSALGMAFKSLDGGYLRINDKYCQITGYARDELFTKRFQEITHPDDIAIHAEVLKKLSSGESSSCEFDKRYIHKAGHDVWVRLTLSLIRDDQGTPLHLIAAAQDITAERAAQEQIAKLSLVASKTRHSVIIAGPDGAIQWVNEGFTNLTEYTAEEAIGAFPGELLQGPETESETKSLIRDKLRRMESVSVEILNYTKRKRPYWINLEIDPVFDKAGELTYFIATQTDITERKRRSEQLERAIEAAESANHAKSRFLANMSHEIRTPLNGILGFTEVLLRDWQHASPAEVDEHLGTVRRSGQHLLTLINDVLDISKIEAEKMCVELIPCSPHQIISDTISILRVTATEKGIGLDYRWEGAIPNAINSDPYRFKQMLLNVIGNAIKFTDQGAVVVVAYIDTAANDQLVVEIRDTGTGIPEDKLETIFEPFVQADDTVTRKYGGTGLGLSISKKIAHALGGNLSVASVVGRGSTFTARIATGGECNLGAVDRNLATSDVQEHTATFDDLNGLSVLVVDDGDTNRKLIRLLLERAGAKVWLAENGQVAVDMVSHAAFDVILMDMQMPVLDGYAATSKIRKSGFTIPIVALTANAMSGDRDKCLKIGCSGYLSKPIDCNSLYSELSKYRNVDAGKPKRPSLIKSELPTNDPVFRDIVEQFLQTFESKMGLLEKAWDQSDFDELGRIAHWLRGAAGTVGYHCFTDPAAELEQVAVARSSNGSREKLDVIQDLRSRLTV